MQSARPALITALGLGITLLFVPELLAQRAFVSAKTGSDSNPCTLGSPCRSFNTAITTVAAGGEVVVLDSGGYGPFTVGKAVSVETPAGIYAGVSAISGNGIDVSAGASDIVVLRGLTINGFSGAANGIIFLSGAALFVETCVVNGFHTTGILQQGDGNLFLTDTTVRSCHDSVTIAPSSAANATLSVDHCRFENGNTGLVVYDGVTASVRDSVASGNSFGLAEASAGTAPAQLNIENCLVANNVVEGIGTLNAGTGTIRVSGSTVSDNGTGLHQTGGHTFESFGNNHVRGNGTQTAGTITQVSNN